MGRVKYMIRRVLPDAKGSCTLEATIIIPVILLILLSVCFYAMYLYQKLALMDTAIYAARQRAVTWDNSRKNLETGSLAGSFDNDGLYWRVFSDFAGCQLVEQKTKTDAVSNIRKRLEHGVFKIEGNAQQEVSVNYENRFISRNVEVKIAQKVVVPFGWLAGALGKETTVEAHAVVSEPVEYIRNCDLAADYWPEIKKCLPGGSKDQADDTVKENKKQAVVYVSKARYDDKDWYNNVYHTNPSCIHVKRIKEYGNLATFNSSEEAKAAGYRLCIDCAEANVQ